MEENRCSVCGSIVPAGDALCPNCGSPVEAAEPVPPVGIEPVAPEVTEPAAPVAAEPVVAEGTKSAVNLGKPETKAVSEETTVLSGNPGYQASGTYNSSSATYNATYQDMPMDSTNYQGGYPQNTGVYTQTVEEPKKNSGKGLGIAAMIIGIISILCCVGGSLFGIIGIILAIVCMAKKTGKPFSIIGLITSILGFVLGIIVLVSLVSGAGLAADVADEMGLDSYDLGNGITYDSNDSGNGTTYVSNINQMVINGDTYTVPGTLSSMGLTVDELDADEVESITTYGLAPTDYKFVQLNSDNGYSVWGYLENTSDSTVYSLDELQVTGLNVDNYSGICSGSSVTVYGGVTLDMSRSDVENLIGKADWVDTEDSQIDIYEDVSTATYLRIKYDDDDYVEELDITYYVD